MTLVGFGYDIHRLAPGRPLWLAGIEIPGPTGAVGDSDADVVVHALIDALLGALGLGDIGSWFPREAVQPGQPSGPLLSRVLDRVADRAEVANADITVLLEAPRLAPHRAAMVESLECLLRCPRVSVKFKTHDGLGEIGRGEAVAAWAAVAVEAAVLP
jgi:2-C-methyl-D-erythritol 2,4-cyclodiphosphate synthase